MAIPAPDQPAIASVSSPVGVTITIADGKEQVSAGQMVRYEVTVHNAGEVEAPLTVKLMVPARAVTGLEASNAAVVANAVAWKNVVGAGETRIYSLAARVDRDARDRSLEVTACVHDRIGGQAFACATDRDEVAVAQKDDTGARRMAWIGSIMFGILAVIGAVWLYRKVNPDLLTPESAAAAAHLRARPGGAPSD